MTLIARLESNPCNSLYTMNDLFDNKINLKMTLTGVVVLLEADTKTLRKVNWSCSPFSSGHKDVEKS